MTCWKGGRFVHRSVCGRKPNVIGAVVDTEECREAIPADSRQSARAMSNFCSFGAVLPSTTSCLELRHSHEAALIRGDHSAAIQTHTRVRVRLRPWGRAGRRCNSPSEEDALTACGNR